MQLLNTIAVYVNINRFVFTSQCSVCSLNYRISPDHINFKMSQQVNDTRPSPPSWLNKDFIQTALRAGSGNPSTAVLSYKITTTSAMGDGYMINVYRVVAKTQDNEEHRLIVKCEEEGAIQENVLMRWGAFQRETFMLAKILPAMQKICEEVKLFEPLAPKCFYNGEHPVPFLVVEDLRQAGFTLAEHTGGIDMVHCTLIMKAFARFHAASIALLEREPNIFDEFKESPFIESVWEFMQPKLRLSLHLLEKTVVKWPGYENLAEKIRLVSENAYDWLMSVTKAKEGKFNTLVHGDPWTNNIMFKYSDGVPQSLRLVDLQRSYYTSPTIDLQHFLTLCPNEESRDNTDTLLQEYHRSLVETMDLLHCRSPRITFPEFKDEYYNHSVYGFLYAASLLHFMFTDLSKQLNMVDQSTYRAIECTLQTMETGVYKRIMKKLLSKYEQVGMFQ